MRRAPRSITTALIAILLAAPAVARAEVVWRGDFEAGTTAQFASVVDRAAISVVDAPARHGRSAARIELRADDANDRAALVHGNAVEGTDRYYAFSAQAPRTLAADFAHELATFVSGRSGKPLLAFLVSGTRVQLVTLQPERREHYGGFTAQFAPGKWHDVVLHVVWSRDAGKGLIEAWYDGDKFVDHVRMATMVDDGPVAMQVGLTRARGAAEALFVDEVAEATRLQDVRPNFVPSVPGDSTNDIEFSRPGGVSLRLDAWVPKGKGPFPAAILTHGGGFVRGDKQSYVLPLFEVLARAGYACFTIDYRLAPDHKYPAPVDDVEAAVAWVHRNAARFKVDRRRVILMGESASAYLVSLVGTRHERDELAAVLPWYGSHRFRAPATMPKGGTLIELFGINDVGPATAEMLRKASPIEQVRADMPPYLFMHSDDDAGSPDSNSEAMCAAMKRAGATCDVFVTHGMGHGLFKWKDAPAEHRRVVEWLDRTLGRQPRD